MLPLELVMREFEAGKFHEIVVSIIVHHCLNIGFGNRLLDFWPLFGHIYTAWKVGNGSSSTVFVMRRCSVNTIAILIA